MKMGKKYPYGTVYIMMVAGATLAILGSNHPLRAWFGGGGLALFLLGMFLKLVYQGQQRWHLENYLDEEIRVAVNKMGENLPHPHKSALILYALKRMEDPGLDPVLLAQARDAADAIVNKYPHQKFNLSWWQLPNPATVVPRSVL